MTLKRTLMILFILATMIAAPVAVLRAQSGEERQAQTPSADQQPGSEENRTEVFFDPFARFRERQAQQLEGSWVVTVSPVPPPGVQAPPSFRAYANFARGGAYLGADRRRPSSKQFGSWVHLYGNEFAATIIEDFYDQSGNFTGTLKLRQRYIVVSHDEFVGVTTAEERDANGDLLFTRCARSKGERIKIEPLAPQCQSLSPFQ
jgi:hypothetical protein